MIPPKATDRRSWRAPSCPHPPRLRQATSCVSTFPGRRWRAWLTCRRGPSPPAFASRPTVTSFKPQSLRSTPLIWPTCWKTSAHDHRPHGGQGRGLQDHRRPQHGSRAGPPRAPGALGRCRQAGGPHRALRRAVGAQHRHGCHPPPGSNTLGAGLHPLGAPGIDLIGTHPQMKRADRELAQRTRREYVLEEAFRDLTSDYRHIVIDVGHSEMVQLNVMTIIDVLVVPTTPAKLDADHLINMLEEADLMRQDLRLPSLRSPRRGALTVT